jgi:hypothetical protein
MSNMGLNQLILFNAGWWVFATAAAFGAAVLFWNKGASQLTGDAIPGTKLAIKMSGAGAIWGTTLLLFFFFHPLREYGDVSRIVLITTSHETAQGPSAALVGNDPGFAKALKEARDLYGDADLGLVELIHQKAVFRLTPETGNTFGYPDPIPTGFYELRVTNARTGARKSWGIDLEEAGAPGGAPGAMPAAAAVAGATAAPATSAGARPAPVAGAAAAPAAAAGAMPAEPAGKVPAAVPVNVTGSR